MKKSKKKKNFDIPILDYNFTSIVRVSKKKKPKYRIIKVITEW